MDKKLSNCYISDTYAKTFWCRGDQKLSKFFIFSQKFVAVYKKIQYVQAKYRRKADDHYLV